MALRDTLLLSWQYQNWLTLLLLPFSWCYRFIFCIRQYLYKASVLPSYRAPVPVIVVGNITVGGTGKTPLVIYLVELLRKHNFNPGVISRGYSGSANSYPLTVTDDTNVNETGDEAALIVRRTKVPMVIGPDRSASIKQLLQEYPVDIVISDDGLQHLSMQRDIEICLIDRTSSFNNQHLLPAGPYRESISRLKSVDLVVNHINQPEAEQTQLGSNISMHLEAGQVTSLLAMLPESKLDGVDWQHQATIHAVAGIGNPQRFFNTCRNLQLNIVQHEFPDHHLFTKTDLEFADQDPILMTEKDAVKCTEFAKSKHWYLPVNAKLSDAFAEQLLLLIKNYKT